MMDAYRIKEITLSLLKWLEENHYSSYDHYDFWSSRVGILGRKIFSRNFYLGLPLVASIYCLDKFYPEAREFFSQKQSSAEAIPRIAIGYFRLNEMTADPDFLRRGCNLLKWLKDQATITKHGIGWGLHFDWQGKELIPRSTPCVTLTAYATEAFLKGFELTGDDNYLKTALKSSSFVAKDLQRRINDNEVALSYTPIDHTYVINANAYAAKILAETLPYYCDHNRIELIDGIINYILNQQNADGSWYYYDRSNAYKKINFIDCFHNSFILDNLYFLWTWNRSEQLYNAISRGYNFFVNHFISNDGSVRYYHYYPNRNDISVDVRGCAEAIYTCSLLADIFPGALELSLKIAEWTSNHMMDQRGYFYFRLYGKYWKHTSKMPYVRWVQAPMFNALTYLLTKLSK
jgi:hypothetical protein